MPVKRRHRRLALRLVWACLVAAAAPPAQAAGEHFVLPSVTVRSVEDVYHLSAAAELRLTPPVREALENGVDLYIRWQVNIERARDWWLDGEVASVVQRNRLSYHPLARQYVVTNLNTDERRSFQRLSSALDAIGQLTDFPVVDRVLVDPPQRYRGYVRVHLVHGQLPLPLRATTFFSSAWDLSSGWRAWRFE